MVSLVVSYWHVDGHSTTAATCASKLIVVVLIDWNLNLPYHTTYTYSLFTTSVSSGYDDKSDVGGGICATCSGAGTGIGIVHADRQQYNTYTMEM